VLVVAEHRRAEHEHEVVPGERVRNRRDAGRQHPAEEPVAVGEGQPVRRRRHPGRQAEVLRQGDGAVEQPGGVDVTTEHQRGVAGLRHLVRQLLQLGFRRRRAALDLAVERRGGVRIQLHGPVVVGHRQVARPPVQLGFEHGLRERPRDVFGAARLARPGGEGPHQLRGVDVGEHRLQPDGRAHLLAGGEHQGRARVDGVGQRTHRVARAGGGVQVDQHRAAGRLGVTVGHPDDGAFVQAEDVPEVAGQLGEERQLVGAGVAEDRGQATAVQELVGEPANGGHARGPPRAGLAQTLETTPGVFQ
jgi:hypothetical protein